MFNQEKSTGRNGCSSKSGWQCKAALWWNALRESPIVDKFDYSLSVKAIVNYTRSHPLAHPV